MLRAKLKMWALVPSPIRPGGIDLRRPGLCSTTTSISSLDLGNAGCRQGEGVYRFRPKTPKSPIGGTRRVHGTVAKRLRHRQSRAHIARRRKPHEYLKRVELAGPHDHLRKNGEPLPAAQRCCLGIPGCNFAQPHNHGRTPQCERLRLRKSSSQVQIPHLAAVLHLVGWEYRYPSVYTRVT